MLVSGGLALILVDNWLTWTDAYALMAMLMAVGLAATWMAEEPPAATRAPKSLVAAVKDPLRDFFSREGALLLLILVILYKLGDAFAGTLTTTFLLRGAGFTLTDVGLGEQVAGHRRHDPRPARRRRAHGEAAALQVA